MKLDEKSVIPLYHQLKEILRELIKSGSLTGGQEIPSERQLIQEYGVSRATVRQAIGELEREGLVVRKQGRGTYICGPKITQDLAGEPSFVHQIKEQGLEPSSSVIRASFDGNTPQRIAEMLCLQETMKTFELFRIRSVNSEPLALETLYIPYELAPNLLEQDLENLAVIEYLQVQNNLKLTHSTTTIEPVLTDEFEATQLEINSGMPALLIERTVYAGKIPLCFQKRVIRGDRSKFLLTIFNNATLDDVVRIGLKVR